MVALRHARGAMIMTVMLAAMIVMAVGVIVLVPVMVVMMRRRHRGADRGRAMERLQRADERASLHPEQPHARSG